MNKLLSLIQIHALTLLTFAVAFFFWKDYLNNPYRKVEKDKLAHITGTLSTAGDNMSLPSGTVRGHFIIIKEANTTFIPVGAHFSDFINDAPEGAKITMTYNPQENPQITNNGIQIFSLKYNNKEYITDADDVSTYNNAIDKRRNIAIYITLAGFLAFGLVEVVRRKFLS